MRHPLKIIAVILVSTTPCAIIPVLADHDHDQARQLYATGQILALETIIANHRRQHPGGQLLEAELEFERDRYVYELKMLGDDGVVREFEYDARTGELWRIKRKEEGKE